MKKFLFILILTVCLLLTISVYADDSVTITIGHTNDVHARYLYDEYNTSIGLAKLKTFADSMDIMLDAGDLYSGQAFATLEKGESTAEVIKYIGYDAMTIGNHDWNYGSKQLLNLETISELPILTANVLKDGEPYFDAPYIIKEIDGVKVGIFGVIDPLIYKVINPIMVDGLEFADMVEYAQGLVDELSDQTDVIVTLTHCVDYTPLTEIDGIDIIISGHQHIIVNEVINDTLVLQAGEYLKNVGSIKIEYDKSEGIITDLSAEILTFDELKDTEPNAEVEEIINGIIESQSLILDTVIGESPVDLIADKPFVRFQETNLGRIVTDSYRYMTGSDIAFENGGGLRATLEAGTITYRDVIDVAPFGNYIVVKSVSGEDLLATLEKSIDLSIQVEDVYTGESGIYPENDGQYLHTSGMTVLYNRAAEYGKRIIAVYVSGKLLDPTEMYTVSGNNYIMNSDFYPLIRDSEVVNDGIACDEAISEYVASGEFIDSLYSKRMLELAEYIRSIMLVPSR